MAGCLEASGTWKKSSFSGQLGDCVEVAAPGRVLVRDTKDRKGPALSFSAAAWNDFISAVKEGPLL